MFKRTKLSTFKDKHQGETCLVCGLGPSLTDYMKNRKRKPSGITIGVNDINMLFVPTYQCISEPLTGAHCVGHEDKINQMLSTNCPNVFSVHDLKFKRAKPVFLPLVGVVDEPDIEKIFAADKIPAVMKITTVAIGLALYMGFAVINVIGLDMYGDRAVNNDSNAIILGPSRMIIMNAGLSLFREYGERHGQMIYNLSKNSLITAFPKRGC